MSDQPNHIAHAPMHAAANKRLHASANTRRLHSALFACALALAPPLAAADAQLHPEVDRAVNYSVPQAECKPPEIRRSSQNAGQLERNERASNRYIKCLERYQAGLFADFQFLQGAVRHGVTMPQAQQIAGNMQKLAEVIKSLKGKGVSLAQDQARVISTGLSGNRTMPGAESH